MTYYIGESYYLTTRETSRFLGKEFTNDVLEVVTLVGTKNDMSTLVLKKKNETLIEVPYGTSSLVPVTTTHKSRYDKRNA